MGVITYIHTQISGTWELEWLRIRTNGISGIANPIWFVFPQLSRYAAMPPSHS